MPSKDILDMVKIKQEIVDEDVNNDARDRTNKEVLQLVNSITTYSDDILLG